MGKQLSPSTCICCFIWLAVYATLEHSGPIQSFSLRVEVARWSTLYLQPKDCPQQVVERVMMAQELKLLLASHHLPNREGRICHSFLGSYTPIQNTSEVDGTTMLVCGVAASLTTDEKISLEPHCGATVNSAAE